MCVGGGSGVGRYEEVWRGVERCGEGVLQEKERKKLTVTATTSSNVSPPSPLSASDCDSLDMVYGFTFIQTDPKAFIFFLCVGKRIEVSGLLDQEDPYSGTR